jgi:Sugar (pentulose and hexulose) kinases
MALLGIDLGTTACKVVAYSNDGKVLAAGRREYKIIRPRHQWAEINPYELFDAVKSAIFEVNKSCNEKIFAISFSSQGEGVVPLDGNYKPVGNIIVSYDIRTLEQTEKLRKALGEDFFYKMGGQILASMGTAPKIMWILDNPSYTSKKPSCFACVGDYILSCFGCKPAIDYSLAARTMLFDVHNHKWSQEVLDVVGITGDMLSDVIKAGTPVARISHSIAEELKLPADTVVVTGGHDQACAMLGTGATGKGEAAYSLGTTETLVCSMDHFCEGLRNYGLPCYPHVIENEFITLPGNYTGGIILQWYKEQFGDMENKIAADSHRDVYDVILDSFEDVPSKLLVLPHFTVTGSPFNDAQSTGAIIGLKLDTKKGEFIRGLIEGVTYEILLNITLLREFGIDISALRVVGGGTKSAKIVQLKSDILGIPLLVPKESEAPCKGAALLAAKGIGLIENIKTEWQTKEENIVAYMPNKEYNYYYWRQFEKYRLLYPAIKKITIEKASDFINVK